MAAHPPRTWAVSQGPYFGPWPPAILESGLGSDSASSAASAGVGGGQAEAIRVPQAQGTLVKLPVSEESALLPGLLTLADVLCTGYHCPVRLAA